MVVVAKKLVKKVATVAPAPAPQQPAAQEQIEVVQPEAEVTKEYSDGTQTSHKEPVGGPIMVKPPQANVGVSMGMTRNLGDYNSLKFSVSLFIPCDVDVDQINETFAQVKQWVDERLNEINVEIDQQLSSDEAAE